MITDLFGSKQELYSSSALSRPERGKMQSGSIWYPRMGTTHIRIWKAFVALSVLGEQTALRPLMCVSMVPLRDGVCMTIEKVREGWKPRVGRLVRQYANPCGPR